LARIKTQADSTLITAKMDGVVFRPIRAVLELGEDEISLMQVAA
jgi:hypothetical protein